MGKKKGKKSGGQKEEQATGGQPEKPQKAGGDAQVGPSHMQQLEAGGGAQAGPPHMQQLQTGGGEPGSSKQKKKGKQPPQVMEVGGVDVGPLQHEKKQVQQPHQPLHAQQSPSSDVGTFHGYGRGQIPPDSGKAERRPGLPQQAQATREQPPAAAWGRPKQQLEAAQQPPVQTSEAQARRRGPAGAPPSGVTGAGAQGRTPPIVMPEGVQKTVGETSRVGAITKSFQSLQIPARRDRNKCGTRGRPIIVETNHFALDLARLRNKIVIHYDVTLVPSLPKRLLRAAMGEFRQKHYPQRFPAFDGKKNLYSSGELPFDREICDEVTVYDDETCREKEFKITIKFASEVDLQSLLTYMKNGSSLVKPQEAIQAVDIVLRNAPAFRFVQVGRSFFSPPRDQILDLGNGLEMWYGFFQSAILGWKPFVNVDVAHKGFPSAKNVVDILMEICNLRHADLGRELSVWHKRDFMNYIRGLKVDYMLPNVPTSKRTYKVNNIVRSAVDQKFELDSGRSISVAEYFAQEKKIRLSFPHLPCLHVGSLQRPKPIYVPAELCCVTKGQVINRKMDETQTSNMIKQAATSTDVRKRKIQEAMNALRFNEDPCLKEFGLSVSDRFEKVGARILDPPQLEYNPNNKRNVCPVKGVWRPEAFLRSNKLTHWIILNLNRFTREDDLRRFAMEMQNMGKSLGMIIHPPSTPVSMEPPKKNTHELMAFFKSLKNDKVQLVVVVVPDKGDCYAKVKQVAELNVGILTQCVKGRTMQRMNAATCSNILLKVNSKLNGINHSLASVSRPPCLKKPIMIVGADVTHPSPDQTDIPSVAAVTASHDPKAFQYNIQVRLQPPRVEIIEDLEDIMKKQLLFFHKATQYKPQAIIFFRDGVSEGQFAQVLNSEVNAIRRACSSLEQGYKPKVTFLVVQKRHHTRFFPSPEDADGRNKNVPPGTVVDREITHPTEVDFYLVSHASIQGVSRPTKYRLLWNDDDDMTEDEIEEITYYLCHMFSRCTRSVSYPAPTYYAHLAAYRARVYLVGEQIKLSNLAMEQKKCAVMAEIISGHPMFFV
ncbi:protein argonaute-2-like isoform X2 [Zootermopsis nevadensis]|uniref:protein argonaute-2-like isoform X2 n=1 Tax=Zootermopsis nevadensis TaxID=136037 RepID=UPI000B8ED3EC|nr:protein argonaute-2-like isoform X2 [Zootermopsis nevadensis]